MNLTRYSPAFKEEVVRKTLQRGNRTLAEMAAELNVPYHSVKNWSRNPKMTHGFAGKHVFLSAHLQADALFAASQGNFTVSSHHPACPVKPPVQSMMSARQGLQGLSYTLSFPCLIGSSPTLAYD